MSIPRAARGLWKAASGTTRPPGRSRSMAAKPSSKSA